MGDELRLLPDEPVLDVGIQSVPLAKLHDDPEGPPPTPALVASVRKFGVVMPIAVVERPTKGKRPGGYDVIDGRRRVRAARQAGLERIDARVYAPGQVPSTEVLSLSMNTLRSGNPIAELEAVERLLGRGAQMGEICRATGLTKARVDRLLRLRGVAEDIRQGVKNGGVTLSTAEKVVGLAEQVQDRLSEKLGETGRLTMRDVMAEREVRSEQAIQGGLAAIVAGRAEAFDWQHALAERLEQAAKLVPDGDPLGDELARMIADLALRR